MIDQPTTVQMRTKKTHLSKEFKALNADIRKMASDLSISCEDIEKAFSREPVSMTPRIQGEIKTIQRILNMDTMQEKVGALMELFHETKTGSESWCMIIRNLARIVYSGKTYLQKRGVTYLSKLHGTDEKDHNELIRKILNTRMELESRIHA